MSRYSVAIFFMILASIFFLQGCVKPLPDGMPDLVPFQARVLQGDQPLDGAHVVFKGEMYHYLVDGVTNANGIAKMKTNGKFSGIPCDNYRIIVEKIVETPSKYQNEPIPSEDNQEAIDELNKKRAEEYRPTHSYVEAKYGNADTSGLTVSVSQSGQIELKVGEPVDIISIPPGTAPTPSGTAPTPSGTAPTP